MLEMRELKRSDVLVINSWRADRDTINNLAAPFRFIGSEVDELWFDSYLQSRDRTIRCVTVEASSPNTPLCLTTLSGIDWINRSAVLHIMVAPGETRGKGVGTFSVQRIVEHAFFDMGLSRIELEVLEENTRARHLYEKLGFEYEGSRRAAVFKNGKYVDLLIMAKLQDGRGGL